MRKVIYKLKLDLKSTESGRGILIKRGDAATRELRITLVSGASPYPIEEHTTAILYCSGREPIYAACTVEDGVAVCVLPSAVSEERVRLCELRLIKSDTVEDTVDGMISSPSFRIVSDECVFGDGVIESADSFSALTVAIAKAETAITRAEEAVETSTAAVAKAESLVITSSRIENGELILVTAGGEELNAGRVAGARWYSGTAITGEGDGISAVIDGALEGDYYLNSETSEVYVCAADGVWDFVGSIKGVKGDKGDSVTIMSVEESTEDEGNNAITFSDGTQLNVKNGSRGARGVSGVYVGSGEMPEGYNVQIDPSGEYDIDFSGGGSSGGDGIKLMIVEVTEEYDSDAGETVYSASKTFAEITKQLNAGGDVIAVMSGQVYQLDYADESGAQFKTVSVLDNSDSRVALAETYDVKADLIYITDGVVEVSSNEFLAPSNTEFEMITVDPKSWKLENGSTVNFYSYSATDIEQGVRYDSHDYVIKDPNGYVYQLTRKNTDGCCFQATDGEQVRQILITRNDATWTSSAMLFYWWLEATTPNALTFTGAVEATFDGSEAVTVDIPSGESEDEWVLINEAELDENGGTFEFTTDSDGNSFSLKKLRLEITPPSTAAPSDTLAFISYPQLILNGQNWQNAFTGNTAAGKAFTLQHPFALTWEKTADTMYTVWLRDDQIMLERDGMQLSNGKRLHIDTCTSVNFRQGAGDLTFACVCKMWGVKA